jgi:hypothetical protein
VLPRCRFFSLSVRATSDHSLSVLRRLDGLRPAADWEKLAVFLEPTPGPITAQLQSGVPMLLSTHSLGGMLRDDTMDTERSLYDESVYLDAYLEDNREILSMLGEADEEQQAQLLEEGGTIKVK